MERLRFDGPDAFRQVDPPQGAAVHKRLGSDGPDSLRKPDRFNVTAPERPFADLPDALRHNHIHVLPLILRQNAVFDFKIFHLSYPPVVFRPSMGREARDRYGYRSRDSKKVQPESLPPISGTGA